MRIVMLAWMGWMSVSGAEAVISVQLIGGRAGSSLMVVQARQMAAQMFAGAGFALEWCERAKSCRDWEHRLIVTLEAEADSGVRPGVMAKAFPFGQRNVRIFLDRVRQVVNPLRQAALLAHVLAHEITHLLQGCDRHSRTGVMKARWEEADIAAMQRSPLELEAHDIHLIRMGLGDR